MKKFEYRLVKTPGSAYPQQIQDILNHHGEQGWELITTEYDHFIFKRETSLEERSIIGKRDHGFKISIDDGFCEWLYKFDLPKTMSIRDVMEKVCEALEVPEVPEGEKRRSAFE